MTNTLREQIETLENEIDDLLELCQEFNQQYQTLQRHTQATNERNQNLHENQTKTQARLTALINKLKSLEIEHES